MDSSEATQCLNEKKPAGRDMRQARWIMVCAALYISIFIYGLDTTIAADVQGAVVMAFGHVEQLAWIGAGFPLGSICVVLLNGTLYTNFNMKWVYVSSLVLFEIGSALCGAAPSMNALIVGRVIAGWGGNGVFMGCLNYFSSLTTPEERGLYIAGTGFCWGIGAVLGPVVGGSFVESRATWRWAFYINLVIAAICAPIYLLCMPSVHPITGVPILNRIKRVDFLGLLLYIGIWCSFTIGFTMAGGQWPWKDGRSISTIVIFGILVVMYAVQQTYCIWTRPENRSFPLHLLRSKTQVLLYIAMAANVTAMYVVVYFIPVYFQFVHGDSAINAAVRLLPYVIITVAVNLAAGHLLAKVKYYMPIFVTSGVLMAVGGALLTAYLHPITPTAQIYGFTVILAVGSGLTLQIAYPVSTIKAPKHVGDCLAFLNVSQIGSIAISLVLAGQIFQSTATKNLTKVLGNTDFTSSEIQSAVAGAQSKIFEQISGEQRERAVLAITEAIQLAFVLVCVGGGVLTISGALMKRERLFGDSVRVAA